MRKGGRGWGKDRSVDMDNVAWWGCKEEGWGLVLRKVRGGGGGGGWGTGAGKARERLSWHQSSLEPLLPRSTSQPELGTRNLFLVSKPQRVKRFLPTEKNLNIYL